MTSYLVTLTAQATSIGKFSQTRWYMGVFKFPPRGGFQAVYRGIRNIITINRNRI